MVLDESYHEYFSKSPFCLFAAQSCTRWVSVRDHNNFWFPQAAGREVSRAASAIKRFRKYPPLTCKNNFPWTLNHYFKSRCSFHLILKHYWEQNNVIKFRIPIARSLFSYTPESQQQSLYIEDGARHDHLIRKVFLLRCTFGDTVESTNLRRGLKIFPIKISISYDSIII